MLVKTDNYRGTKKARIILECDLYPSYYYQDEDSEGLKLCLGEIAHDLARLEYDFISIHYGEVNTYLSTVTPVGLFDHSELLVIELVATGDDGTFVMDWDEFVAEIAARIIQRLARGGDDRIARVEIEKKSFVIMDDVGNPDAEPIDV